MDLTDEALIQNFRQTQDPAYFKSMVQRYQSRVYTAAIRLVGTAEEAEEVVQDTFIKMHQNLASFKARSSFAAWLFRIAHNVCMDRLRNRRRKFNVWTFDPQAGGREDGEEGMHLVSQIADAAPIPSDAALAGEQEAQVEKALLQLPDSQRVVVVLHDIEGFSYQEVAEIVGGSIGTVRSRLHYGRLKLKELLQPYFETCDIAPASR